MPPINVTGIDHIYLSVSDIDRAECFYDTVMELLDFRKGTKPIAGERHLHYFNRVTQISIRPAHRPQTAHDPYAPGLHHLCLRVESRADVDTVSKALRTNGIETTAPDFYPEYAPDYYATFFDDPDGIRLEVVAMRELREVVARHWDQLTAFEDPVGKAGLIE